MFEEFFLAYVEAALYISTDNSDESGGEPLDRNYDRDDIAPDTLTKMRADCQKFWDENEHLLTIDHFKGSMPVTHGGTDFWMTRNRHGSGFWDGEWFEPAGKVLTDAAHKFGECDLYVGDDDKIHVQ